jgi:hypothetical protein
MACGICDLQMADGEPTMTLMCNHKFHTLCFIRHYATTNLSDTRCRECNIHVVPGDILQEAEALVNPESRNEIIKFLWETDPDFKSDLKGLYSLKTEQKKQSIMCFRKQREILVKHNEEIEPVVDLMRDVVKKHKNEYKKSDEYIATKKVGTKYHLAKLKFNRRWGVRVWELRDSLKKIPGAEKYAKLTDYMYLWHPRDYKFNVRIK